MNSKYTPTIEDTKLLIEALFDIIDTGRPGPNATGHSESLELARNTLNRIGIAVRCTRCGGDGYDPHQEGGAPGSPVTCWECRGAGIEIDIGQL